MANSTSRRRPRHHQNAKPYDGFPLTAHPTGRWCKKVRGKVIFFGKIGTTEDAQAALDKWEKQKDDLLNGRIPREEERAGGEKTLRDLVIAYLRHQKAQLDNGELSPRTFADCYRTCSNLIDFFGKYRLLDDMREEDFAGYRKELAKCRGFVALGNAIRRTRSVFKFGTDTRMFKTPITFGVSFKPPSKKALRLEKAKKGAKLFSREELHKLLDVAGIPLKAMILLALNGGLGNADLANMPLSAIDLKTGWVDYPRVKTGVDRRFPLWKETIESLHAVIKERPTPKAEADAGLLFVTQRGGRWCKEIFRLNETEPDADEVGKKYTANFDDPVGKEFRKLFTTAKVARKKGCSFYTLRHVFQTEAEESRDLAAVRFIMGHIDPSMSGNYREKISDARLQAAVDAVHAWLFPATGKPEALESKQA